MTGHLPVLLEETVGFFDFPGLKVVVDGTVGGGGHAEALLVRYPAIERYVGFDRDDEAVARCEKRLARFGDRVEIVHASFYDMNERLDRLGIGAVDGVLLDLGVSSYQLDDPGRGFSFSADGPLDMRMDRRQAESAADLVDRADEAALTKIFFEYGEEKFARRIARAIVAARGGAPIATTGRLAEIVAGAIPRKAAATSRIHPATRVFMALRIAVNDELGRLARLLETAVDRIRPEGRIAVIAFHSLEDRIVKRTLVDLRKRCVCPKSLPVCDCGEPGKVTLVTRKPVTPGEAELAANPRARSARLRVAQKLPG